MHEADEPQQYTPTRIQAIDAGEWLESEPPAPDQVMEDTLDAGDKLCLIASSKRRKSFLFLGLALSLAAGRKFLTWSIPMPRQVLYVQYEVRKDHTHRRLRHLAAAMSITSAEIEDRLQIITARGLNLVGQAGLDQIRTKAAELGSEVIMLDPIYKLATGVENAAEDFKTLLNGFDQLAEETGAAIMYVHHDPKGSPGDRDPRDRGAGSNVLGRDYDACIILTPHSNNDDDMSVVEVLLRNYPPQESFTVVWDKTERGYYFNLAADVAPEKKTSRTKPSPPPLSTFWPTAKEILLGGRVMGITAFKAELKDRTGLSNARVKDLLDRYIDGDKPELEVQEARGKGIHKKTVRLAG